MGNYGDVIIFNIYSLAVYISFFVKCLLTSFDHLSRLFLNTVELLICEVCVMQISLICEFPVSNINVVRILLFLMFRFKFVSCLISISFLEVIVIFTFSFEVVMFCLQHFSPKFTWNLY